MVGHQKDTGKQTFRKRNCLGGNFVKETSAPVRSRIALAVAATLAVLSGMPGAYAAPGSVCNDDPAAPIAPAPANCVNVIPTYYANSPTLRKFVDSLPGLTAAGANKFDKNYTGEYIPLAVADKLAYAGSDFYIIGIVEHEQRMHSDLQKATRLRGYVQLIPDTAAGTTPDAVLYPNNTALSYPDGTPITWPDTGHQVYAFDKPHYLGPIIVATSGTPVRVKMVNFLPPNSPLFLPVDESLGGAGMTPDSSKYTQSRASFHLHGGDSPWISDGTPHQWVAAVRDTTAYKKGERLANVPDMPEPGEGSQTIFWPNDQSARLMWYHDHSFGLTRQNAYSGEAAGYLIVDAAETALLTVPAAGTTGTTITTTAGKTATIGKALPGGLLEQIPLVIQDKSFVPDDIAQQDAKWDTNVWGKPGDLWYPHVYEPIQVWNNPSAPGTNPAGRWNYAMDPVGGYVTPKFALPDGSPGHASATPESYMDTPLVNGVAYPYMNVEPKAYRVRFLNGANDRYFNLSLWVADDMVTSSDGRSLTEVKPSIPAIGGSAPAPTTAGPNIIQFANEAGLLPTPVVHKAAPAPLDATGAMTGGSLFLGGAERADTVIDFSQYAGKTLILYNDSTAPVPVGDPRYDYYTNNVDQSAAGGAQPTLPGYGPNTRTIMQIRVAANLTSTSDVALPYDPAGTGGPLLTELPKAYAATATPLVVTTKTATAATPTTWKPPVVSIVANSATGNTITLAGTKVALPLKVKTIEGGNEPNYGRLIAQIGSELPGQAAATPLAYIDTPSDIINGGETQYWLIKNNDGDNHPMHFHLFNVQVIARMSQTAPVVFKAPELNEQGWKETVKNWPGEDLIVALKPKTPQLPFGLPNSVRLLDPTLPEGTPYNTALFPASQSGATPPYAFTQFDLITGLPVQTPVANSMTDFGWEYVWHCHILGHEENDLMRPIVFRPVISVPVAPSGVKIDSTGLVSWVDATPAGVAATKGNPAGEIGFRVERADITGNTVGTFSALAASGVPNSEVQGINAKAKIGAINTLANKTSFQDTSIASGVDYAYRVVAVNQAGETASAATRFGQIAPAAPSNLTATAAGTSVTLGWTDNATNGTGYVVKRASGSFNATTGIIAWAAATSLPTATSVLATGLTSYADITGVKANTLYQYQVYAVNGTLPGGAASTIASTATTLAAPAQLQSVGTATTTSLGVQWQSAASGLISGYEVQRCSGTATVCVAGGTGWASVGKVVGAKTQKFVDSGLTTKTSYSYQIRAINDLVPGLVSPWSAVFSQKTK